MIDKRWVGGEAFQKHRKAFVPVCDGCGKQIANDTYDNTDFYSATDAIRRAGWSSVKYSSLKSGRLWADLCPECYAKCHPTAATDFVGFAGPTRPREVHL